MSSMTSKHIKKSRVGESGPKSNTRGRAKVAPLLPVTRLVAGPSLLKQAFLLTECERPSRAMIVAGSEVDELYRERDERVRALKHVRKTGEPYRPLIDKWLRGR